MKKLLSLMLAIMLVLSLGVVAYAADDYYTFDLTQAEYEVEANDTVTVALRLYKNASSRVESLFNSVTLVIPKGFVVEELTSDVTSAVAGTTYTVQPQSDGTTVVTWMYDAAAFKFTSTTKVLSMALKAPAVAGSYTITNKGDVTLADKNGATLSPVSFVGATVNVTGDKSSELSVSTFVTNAPGGNGYTPNEYYYDYEEEYYAEFSLFAKAVNAAKYGIILGTEEFATDSTLADSVAAGTCWILEADGANSEGWFVVTAFEDGAGNTPTRLNNEDGVWACAYAADSNGTTVFTEVLEYGNTY